MANKQTALNAFLKEIANQEKKKSSVSIGNLREVLRLIDKSLDGKVYKLIDEKYSNIEGGEYENIKA